MDEMTPVATQEPAGHTAKRWWLLAVMAGALFLLAFYSLSDPARLAHDPLLTAGDYAGYAICHRITERSFTIAGRQFPLCARCTGTYLGVMLAFGALLLAGRGRRAGLPVRRVLVALALPVAIMGLDGLNSYSHFFPGAHEWGGDPAIDWLDAQFAPPGR